MTIKAIETKYKGYRFRSRTEARWAVALDTLRIPWEYEAEGFDLKSGYYLPDFWLPANHIYLEVKGVPPTAKEINIITDLAIESDQKRVGFLVGQPSARPFPFVWWDTSDDLRPVWRGVFGVLNNKLGGNPFIKYVRERCVTSGFSGTPGEADDYADVERFLASMVDFCDKLWCPFCVEARRQANWYEAIEAARSARFEHGERPR